MERTEAVSIRTRVVGSRVVDSGKAPYARSQRSKIRGCDRKTRGRMTVRQAGA